MIYITPNGHQEAVDAIADSMRKEDRDEVWASHHHTPMHALRVSVGISSKVFTACDSLGVFAMFGVAPYGSLFSDTGVPWMLGTDRVRRNAIEVMRHTASYIEDLQEGFSKLVNWVDARNTISIRWLRHFGFTIEEPEPYGMEGLPFHRFHMEISDV